MKVGILALQGAYVAHQKKIERQGVECVLVKTRAQLAKVDALILPGGESTAISLLLKKHGLWDDIVAKVKKVPVLATCAGIILLQKMGALNVEVIRNAYGRQLASGVFPLTLHMANQQTSIDGFFIRAPLIVAVHDLAIQCHAYFEDRPVLIEKENIIAATFHPELSESNEIHQYFLSKIK